MNVIDTIKDYWQRKVSLPTEKSVVEAYDLWSSTYDDQPSNLMLHLDTLMFEELLQPIKLEQKRIADIGCGTGRHWPAIHAKNPKLVIGFDVSAGMLSQLTRKYPVAVTHQLKDNSLNMVPDNCIDCIVSTLTVAHIDNLEHAMTAWARILNQGGDVLLTDFHPAALAIGGKRSFQHQGRSFFVTNHVHTLEKIKNKGSRLGFVLVRQIEKVVNEELKPWYEKQNALSVYERFKGKPIIYGLHLRKLQPRKIYAAN